jgi:hypothetical protein
MSGIGVVSIRPTESGIMDLSIMFSDEELAALANILSEKIPRVGPSTLDGLSTARRAERIRAAELSLRARGIVVTTPGGDTEVAVPVARLVEILSRPVVTVSIHRGAAAGGWQEHATQIAVVPEAAVLRVVEGGLHRLTPFATPDVLRRVATSTCLTSQVEPGDTAVQVDVRALARSLSATSEAVARQELRDATGNARPETVAAMVAAICTHRAAIGIQGTPHGGRSVGLQLAWVAGPAGAWELPVSATPLAGEIGSAPRDDGLVTLDPVGGPALLRALAAVGEAAS